MTTDENYLPDFTTYVEVTLERLIVAHIEDSIEQIGRSKGEKLRLFLAARSVHLALVTALSSALSGTDGTGAMSDKERKAWLRFFDDMRGGLAEAPKTRMASFSELLKRAQECPTGYIAKPLQLDENEERELKKLTALRDWTEHPRPDHHLIEPAWILDAMKVGLRVTQHCTELVWHRYDALEQERLEALFGELRQKLSTV
jgi:hypothetical protein|tara:strand:+ start:424 stop:1026 length:603 start_codon:yes stop_codon:yes gene_type:complete